MRTKIEEFNTKLINGMSRDVNSTVGVLTVLSFLLGVYVLMTFMEMYRLATAHEWLSLIWMIPIFVVLVAVITDFIGCAKKAIENIAERDEDGET